MGKIFRALEKFKDVDRGNTAAVKESSPGEDLAVESPPVLDDPVESFGLDNLRVAEAQPYVQSQSDPDDYKAPGSYTDADKYKDLAREQTEPHVGPKAPVPSQLVPSQQNLDKSLITHLKPHSVEAEQFRILKTAILFPQTGIPPRTIMVTSTVPGEGKSFVASNIAISIAQSIDEYVLLMDCDLRRPSQHSRFGFSNVFGLSDHLAHRGEKSLGSIILKTAVDKLSLLPAGKPPANPSELISSEEMRFLLQEVKDRYHDRYIIIDSPPPYLTAEANALARQVDGIVIVVKKGKTKRSHMRDLIDTYGKDKILGVVKNFSEQKHGYKQYVYK
ncbi:MAG: polysaccharide biosynthesis tyrosine autokinase [Desulfobacterium sp.]|nr:polysaccharide biosynthesis tyrosine autokinase [Desulfobacterium sp.]